MTRMICVLLLIGLLVGCAPVVDPPTPTATATVGPVVVTPTPDYTDPHSDWPPFSQVNKNYWLDGPPNMVAVGDPWVQVRSLAIPPLWAYVGDTANNIPPYFYRVDCVTEDDAACYRIEPGWVAGDFCLAEDNIPLQGDTRYIVKIRADKLRLEPTDGNEWTDDNVSVYTRLWVSDGSNVMLTGQPVPMRGDEREWIWVVESAKRYPTVRLEACFRIQWATVMGSITLDDIEILTAPPGFGDDAVVGF